MPAGRQVVTAGVAPTYFLRRRDRRRDRRPPAAEARVEAPVLGKINIRANPDNCQVFIDGDVRRLPADPRPSRSSAGEHRVTFKWPDGARHEETVEVAARQGRPS